MHRLRHKMYNYIVPVSQVSVFQGPLIGVDSKKKIFFLLKFCNFNNNRKQHLKM